MEDQPRLLSALRQLSCPFVRQIEDGQVNVLSPAEPRWQFLEWLLNTYDASLLSNVSQTISAEAARSRTAVITTAVNVIGVRSPFDPKVVEGACSREQNLVFLESLVDLVLCRVSPFGIQGEFDRGLSLLRTIAEDEANVFSSECVLFPPHIMLAPKPARPDLTALAQQGEQYTQELSTLTDQLARLRQTIPTPSETDRQTITVLSAHPSPESLSAEALRLKTALERFTGAITAFNGAYTNELQAWTKPEPPQLTSFGPLCSRLLSQQQMVAQFADHVATIRSSFQRIDSSATTRGLAQLKAAELGPEETHKLNSTSEIISQSLARRRAQQQRSRV